MWKKSYIQRTISVTPQISNWLKANPLGQITQLLFCLYYINLENHSDSTTTMKKPVHFNSLNPFRLKASSPKSPNRFNPLWNPFFFTQFATVSIRPDHAIVEYEHPKIKDVEFRYTQKKNDSVFLRTKSISYRPIIKTTKNSRTSWIFWILFKNKFIVEDEV